MRRKSGAFVPLELAIIHAAKHLHQEGIEEFYGFQINKRIQEEDEQHRLIGYGTLYRALSRLQKRGILQSRWEELLPGENRPRRRYYRLHDLSEVSYKGIMATEIGLRVYPIVKDIIDGHKEDKPKKEGK